MFNRFDRFDQAELPVTDAFGMPFSTLRKRQVEDAMPEVQLRPNDPAILAANQTSDMGMPIRQPEPQRPFVPEYQPPNPVGDLMPLPGAGRGGATTRQNIPEDDNGDRNNGQSINPLSSIALSKLQDFEAQGVPQQNPKLWQKLLALAAGAGSVVAAMNAERVRPDTQALAGMTNSILYPNEERNRARWLDQRALLRDAVRTEQTGNENVLAQMDLQRKANVDQSTMQVNRARAEMYATRAQQNIAKMLEAGKIKPEEAKSPATFEAALTQILMQDVKSGDPEKATAAKKELERLQGQKRTSRMPQTMEAEVMAIMDEIRKKATSAGQQLSDEDARTEALIEYGRRSTAAKAANIEGTKQRTELTKKNINKPVVSTGGRGRQLTPLQQQNAAINKVAASYLNATKNPDTTMNHEAAIKAIEADATLDQATKDAAVLAVQKMRRSKGSGDSRAFVDEFMINMNKKPDPGKTPKVETTPTTQTSAVAAPTKQQPPKGTAKTSIKIDPKTGNMRTAYLDAKGKEITVY